MAIDAGSNMPVHIGKRGMITSKIMAEVSGPEAESDVDEDEEKKAEAGPAPEEVAEAMENDKEEMRAQQAQNAAGDAQRPHTPGATSDKQLVSEILSKNMQIFNQAQEARRRARELLDAITPRVASVRQGHSSDSHDIIGGTVHNTIAELQATTDEYVGQHRRRQA